MTVTLDQVVTQVTDLVTLWTANQEQYADWMAGPADGGFEPNGTTPGGGYYPLTDSQGTTVHVPSIAKILDVVVGPAGEAGAILAATNGRLQEAEDALAGIEAALSTLVTYRDAAASSATAAASSSAAALTSANNADTSEANAATSETNALASKNAAATSATNAATSATNSATSEANALSYRNAAQTAKTAAETAATDADADRVAAQTAKTAAETAQAAAVTARTGAETARTGAEAAQSNLVAARDAAAASAAAALASANSIGDAEENALASEVAADAARDEAQTLVSAAIASAVETGTRSQCLATTIPGVFNAVRTTGWANPGDGGGAFHKRFTGTLSGAGFVDAAAAKFEFADTVARPEMLGGGFGNATDNLAALTYLFNTPMAPTIQLAGKTYDIGAGTLDFTLSNVHVKGVRGLTKITTSAKTLLDMGTTSDCVFEDITLISTAVDATDDSVNAVLRWFRVVSRRIKFIRCRFQILTANANCIKAICPDDGELTESIYFEDCEVLGAGRMGVEVDNTNLDDTVTRHFDWRWHGGVIRNCGLVSTEYGQAFSVCGWVEDFILDIRADNCKGIAIEMTGACNSRFSGRVTNMVDAALGVGACSPLAFTNNGYLKSTRKMTDNVVENFVADDGTGGEIRFWYQDRLVTKGNYFKLTPKYSGTGNVTYCGSSNCKSVGDRYDCAGNYALEVRTLRAHGGASANNTWVGLNLDHSRAPSDAAAYYLIVCVGEGTENNVINGLVYNPKTISKSVIGQVSETTLTASIASNTLTVTAQGGYCPVFAGQRLYGDGVLGTPVISPYGTGGTTGTGGVGTYHISGAGQTLSSRALTTGRAQKNFVRGISRRSDGFDLVQRTYGFTSNDDVNLNLSDTSPSLFSVPSLIINSVNLLALRTLIVPEGFGPIRVTNSTTGGQSIKLDHGLGGTTVTITNGSTVTVVSTPTGIVVLP